MPSVLMMMMMMMLLFPRRVPLERGSSEGYRQREARAARLANEIETSLQYRQRANLENDEGKSEEDKYSAVLRDAGERERERGRDSPGATRWVWGWR